MNLTRCALTVIAAAIALGAPPAFAQGKTTRLIVGFAPGGPIDLVARVLSEPLGKELGHTVIVENKPGANAGIAAEYVAKAAPDGQTLFMTSTGAVAISPALYDKLPYDPVRDFAPVTLVVSTAEVLVASASNPPNTAPEFIATGVDSDNWYAIFAPKATPAAEIERIGQAVRRTLENDAVKQKLLASGVEPAPTSPAQLAALLKSDSDKWARIIKLKYIKGE
jgi:tripartite-type tricarboxylate transporter receptor subunit TctC